ncbi:hypothetical protein BJ912DRAFT_926768 [Pholiota molesta]|nr:hypothetical protein BJ912DRAFT_926768 [Pholiota molesta]
MLVEYPETGCKLEYSVGHRFAIDPQQDFINPHLNIQFSLGDGHGGQSNIPCRLLVDETTGKAAICKNTKYGCCLFDAEDSSAFDLVDSDSTEDEDSDSKNVPIQKLRVPTSKHCRGKMALLGADNEVISLFENEAKLLGYGPLVPCTYMASASAQKALCPYWHRFSSNQLRRGSMKRCLDEGTKACQATFSIFEPNNLSACPFILIICKGPHTHVNPFPVKTPPSIYMIFSSLLLNMGWRLADATPRNIMLDSGFMKGLRQHLAWMDDCREPVLSDLHPSLGNSDHVRRYINSLRVKLFPRGTGFEGAQLLVDQQLLGPEELQYNFSSLSACLTQYSSTSGRSLRLKRGTWIGCDSAEAHLILFTRIFEIAERDTGSHVQFKHIHGDGFLTWIADAHMGQALQLCMELDGYCSLETPFCRLSTLSPYDHLRRFFRQCIAHFKRKIQELGSHISPEVKAAMLSLASAEPHPDLDGAFKIIENGGPKAKAWLKDKRVTNKFALAGLCQPLSLIPLDVWKASPSTTNGNEQSHRNINRDGVNLTILGGIMLGMQYDFRATASRELRPGRH